MRSDRPRGQTPQHTPAIDTSTTTTADSTTIPGFRDPGAASTLMQLLKFAQDALPGDTEQAARCVAAARALLKFETSSEAEEEARVISGLAPWQLHRVYEFVDANLSRPLHVDDLASLARLSTSHFSSAFRRSTGESPFRYLRRRRIDHAQQMMLLTNLSLAEISVDCGFADQAHLTKLFRRMVGVCPGAWRRLRRTGSLTRGLDSQRA
jgi:AraC family transcriptional regulator